MFKFKFDEEKALQKYMKETGESKIMASPAIESLKTIDKKLRPCVIAWLNDEELPNFEFHGVTLSIIMEKEHESYIGAILGMDCILESENPKEEANYYLERKFWRK